MTNTLRFYSLGPIVIVDFVTLEDLPPSLEKLHGQLNEPELDSNLAGDGKTDALSPTNDEISGLKRDRDEATAVGDVILEPPDSQRQRTEDDKKSDFQPPLPRGRAINEGQQQAPSQSQQHVQETATNELESQPQAASVADAASESNRVVVGAQPGSQNFGGNPGFMVPVVPAMAAFQPPPFMPQPFLVNATGRGFQQWQPQISQGQYAMTMQPQPTQAGEVQKNETQGSNQGGQEAQDANQQLQQQPLASSQGQQNMPPAMIALPPGQQFLQQHVQGGQSAATDTSKPTTAEQGTDKEEGAANASTGGVPPQPTVQGVPQQQIPSTNGVMYYPPPMFSTGGVPMQPHGISETDAAAIRSRMMLTQFPTIPPGMMAPPFMINPAGGPIPPNIVQRFDASSAAAAAAAATGFVGQPVVVPRTNGITLSLSCDEEQLSEYQILVRKQLEIFEATQEDVESNTQGRKKQVTLGQVGIRCR